MPAAFPTMSQSAMSIPLIACMTMPRRPCWRGRPNINCQRYSIFSGSWPISSGFSSCSITAAVLAGGPPADPASAMPVSPASVSISTISALRAALKLAALMLGLAARYDSWMVRISVIFMAGPLAAGPAATRVPSPDPAHSKGSSESNVAVNARPDGAHRSRTTGDDLWPGQRCHTVSLRPKRSRLPTMSTLELVDPELRDALALAPQLPLTAATLARRRTDALALLTSVPIPDLPDIETGEIHVESAFGAKPIRVLTYRPVRSGAPLPAIVHVHGGGFVMGAPGLKGGEKRLF